MLAAAPVLAAEPDIDAGPEIGLLDFGTYSGRDAGVVFSDTTVEGAWHRLDSVKLLERGTDICAGDGTMFGIRYRLSETAAQDFWQIEVHTAHPMLHAPNGRSGIGGVHVTGLLRGDAGYSGWTVRYPYEHVPGDYTFSLVHDGQVKLRKTFHVAFDCVPLVS